MTEITTLREAVAAHVKDGDTVSMEGFTHLIPTAAGHEIIRQGRRDLHLIRMTPDLIYDQMIGMGCARKLTFSWGGNPGVGSLHRLRDAVERDWPHPIEVTEHAHAAMASAYVAGASGLPMGVLRAYKGCDLPKYNDEIRSVTCPFTGEELTAVPAIRPDVSFIHAQRADRQGNVLLWGILGVQKECVMAARKSIITVEEIVDDLQAPPNATILPAWVTSAVVELPGGAHPSYAQDYTRRDNAFYKAWDPIGRDRQRFLDWMEKHILGTEDFAAYRRMIGGEA